MPATDDDTLLPFSLPGVCQKKVTAAFDAGRISSDGGVVLLAGADRKLGLIDTLAALMPDHRNPAQINHSMADILRARGRREAMHWCERNNVQYVFGLSGNAVLDAPIFAATNDVCVRRATSKLAALRDFTETRYAAESWRHPRRVVARIEASLKGLDVRYVVSNIAHGSAEWLYSDVYCARGQAENLIKRHKGQLASDRTSCRSPPANQMRLILHTAAYWLIRAIRDAIIEAQPLASGEFSTLRLRLFKIAVRIKETASRVRLAFASNCPDQALLRDLVGRLVLRPT